MKAGFDGSITISTNIDTSGFKSDVKTLDRIARDACKKIESQAQKSGQNVGKSFSSVSGSIKSSLAGIKGSLLSLGAAAAAVIAAKVVKDVINFSKECVQAASDMQNALIGLNSIMSGQGRSFADAQKFINTYTEDGLIPATQAINAYKNLALRGYDDSQIQQVLVALKDSAAFGRQASYSLGEAVESATEGLKNENSILVDNAGVTKNVAKMWDEYAKSIGTTSNNLTQAQKIQAEVAGILEESKYQVGDAAKVTSTYSGQILQLGYNFNNLKIAIGNGIMPVVQAVLPGLNAIIKALTKVGNVFAQVMAVLFGKSVKQQNNITASAVSASKAEDKLAKSTKKAGDATEKAGKQVNKSLASFDELNVLAENTSDSMESMADNLGSADIASVGGTSVDDGFSLGIEVSPEIQAFLSTLSDSWERLKETINEFIESPGVQAVVGWFRDLVTALWERAADAALLSLAGAFDVLSGALDIVAGLLNIVVGIFTGDFDLAVDGAREIVKGLEAAIEGIGKIIEAVFVVLFGREATDAIKDFLLNGVGPLLGSIGGAEDVINGLKEILNGLITFIKGTFTGDWEQAWEGVKTSFKGVFDTICGLAKYFINLIIGFINGMISGITAGMNFIVDKINELSFTVPDWVPDIGGEKFGFNLPKFVAFKIPMLATGAVIPPNSQFLAVLGDQKSGRNLEAPEGLIRQILREELSNMDFGSQDINLNVVAELDGETVYKNQQKVAAKRGYAFNMGAFAR